MKLPSPQAARSLAMPLTPKQSDRFGVIDMSIIGSKFSVKKLSPIFNLFFNSIIPSLSSERLSSDSEQSIPKDSTPLIFATESFMPFFGMTVPGEA